MKESHFTWDSFSDQPLPLTNRAYKKKMRKLHLCNILWTLLISIIIFPFAILLMPFIPKPKTKDLSCFFGMGVNLDKELPKIEQKALIDDLQVDHLIIRLPLADIENIHAYIAFINQFKTKDIMVNLLQDRLHIEDQTLLQESIRTIFGLLPSHVTKMQVGNAINRTKWGFFSIGEYLRFFSTIRNIRNNFKPELKLIGPSVIDFEYYYLIHALFSFKGRFDAVSSLLYVDRRGAPENRQSGLNLIGKINLLFAIAKLSPFSQSGIYITETNWPLAQTAPYAPTSEFECISLEEYRDYMVRYYLLAIASKKVQTVYWHQLVNAGYGLIDQRESLIKYPAYNAYKVMVDLLKNARFDKLHTQKGRFRMDFSTPQDTISVLWSTQTYQMHLGEAKDVYTLDGIRTKQHELTINGTPLFIKNLI